MWMVLGVLAVMATAVNLIRALQRKEAQWPRFIGLGLTALTVCAFYRDGAIRVVDEDWSGLMDIMPATAKALWVCVTVSILLNSLSLFRED